MPTLEIDGKTITVEDGLNVVQAAERLGIEIPHYCYHPALSISGNCRMCLVEIENIPKLQIACNTKVTQGMVVRTQTERVKRVRESVLEFLLINHPIDCPVCDQAGECKLQDYYMDYDRQPSRFPLGQKVKKGKAIEIGPLVMLDQERCILCSRCTRFLDEVTQTRELAIFERGDHNRIGLFPGRRLDNAYSANVVDICPVGALTNKTFRFRSRVWYLNHTPSVCPTCATGCNIEIHHREGEIFRFRPRYNASVNGYWMCDEGRLSYQRYQGEGRLLKPVVREATGWTARSWREALAVARERLAAIAGEHGGQAIGGVVSAQATNEEAFLFARWMKESLGARVAGWQWSPPDASKDDRLRDADKNANAAGLRALGLMPDDGVLKAAVDGELRALVLFRTDLTASHGATVLDTIGERVDFVLVLDTHYHGTGEIADLQLPIGTFAETDGTYVNRSGMVQRIREACPPVGESRAGWRVLGELLAAGDADAVPVDSGAVFTQLAAAVPAFQPLSYQTIDLQGSPLVEASARC